MLATATTTMSEQMSNLKIKEPEHSVFIGNLSYSTKAPEIEALFSTVAKV
jgi:RNA recognition motif-containing protein